MRIAAIIVIILYFLDQKLLFSISLSLIIYFLQFCYESLIESLKVKVTSLNFTATLCFSLHLAVSTWEWLEIELWIGKIKLF
jgi:hypothetical protein